MHTESETMMENRESVETAAAKGAIKKAGVFFLLLMLFEMPVAVLVHSVQSRFPAENRVLISILVTQGYLLIGAVIYLLATRQSPVKEFRLKPFKVSDFFLSLLILVTAAPMASLLNIVSQFFVKNETSTAIYSLAEQIPMWLGILIIGCLPGVIEELLYRGILFHAFRKRSVWTGVLISGISFGLMHMNFNQIAYAVYLGILFALVLEVTDSLLSTMLLHMLFNTVNTAQIYILPKLYEWLGTFYAQYADFDMEAAVNAEAPKEQLMLAAMGVLPFAAGGIVLTVLLLKAIAKGNGKVFTWRSLSACSGEMKKVSPVTVCLALGWIYCIINAVAAM